MSFPTFPQHGELPATPLPPREAQRGPAGFEKLPAHVLGRGRHRAEHAEASGPDPRRTLLCPLRTGPVRAAQHKQRASSVRATVPPPLPATPRPRKTPPVCRDRVKVGSQGGAGSVPTLALGVGDAWDGA